MTSFSARLSRIEKAKPIVATFKDAGDARKKLAALVDQHGGQQPGESPAQATARVLGISTRQLLAELQEKADA